MGHVPLRTCVGCRKVRPQAVLARFVLGAEGWTLDPTVLRLPGRGVYLCSAACAEFVRKNRRYPGFAQAAQEAFDGGESLKGRV